MQAQSDILSPTGRRPFLENILRRVGIAVVSRLAVDTRPSSISQRQRGVDFAADVTPLRARKPRVNVNHLCPERPRDMVQEGHELPKAQIRDFPAPQSLHGLEVQRLQVDVAVVPTQLLSQLKMEVTALIRDLVMAARQPVLHFLPVMRTFHFPRQVLVRFFNGLATLFKEQRSLKDLSIACGQELREPKVHPDLVTGYANRGGLCNLTGKIDEQLSQRIPLDGDRLNPSFDGTRKNKLVAVFANT